MICCNKVDQEIINTESVVTSDQSISIQEGIGAYTDALEDEIIAKNSTSKLDNFNEWNQNWSEHLRRWFVFNFNNESLGVRNYSTDFQDRYPDLINNQSWRIHQIRVRYTRTN